MNTEKITGYHVHVYFHDAESRAKVISFRQTMQQTFQIEYSPIFEEPEFNDPHQRAGFFAELPAAEFGAVVPWVMLNQNGMNMFIHPITGDHIADHRDFPMWLGMSLTMNLDALV